MHDFELKKLSTNFYVKYNKKEYPEILWKDNRVYSVVVYEYLDYFVAVPFRTNIRHKYAYLFKNTKRSKEHKSGLDYQKMVIIQDANLINSTDHAIIDHDEYKEYIKYEIKIHSKAIKFLEDYINHKQGLIELNKKEFARRYKRSSLRYFEDIIIK